MANELQYQFGAFKLDMTNHITIKGIGAKESKTVQTSKIPKSDGSNANDGRRELTSFSIEGDVSGADYDALRTNFDALAAALHAGKQKLTRDDDRYIIAQLKDLDFSDVQPRRLRSWAASFIAHYPFWLSETLTVDTRIPTSGVGYVLSNPGNAATRIKVRMISSGGAWSGGRVQNATTGEDAQFGAAVASGKYLVIDNRTDTDDYVVTNDGVDAHKDFSGDFLTLAPGNNTIIANFTGSVSVEISYRGAWY